MHERDAQLPTVLGGHDDLDAGDAHGRPVVLGFEQGAARERDGRIDEDVVAGWLGYGRIFWVRWFRGLGTCSP